MERWMGFPSTFFPTGHPSRQCVPSLSSANADCPILAQKINATVQDRINQEIRRFRIDRWAQEFSIKIQLHQGRRPSGRIPSTDSFRLLSSANEARDALSKARGVRLRNSA